MRVGFGLVFCGTGLFCVWGGVVGGDGVMVMSAQDVVAAARAWIGTPYHHQASRRGVGADCLGLVRGVWRELYGFDAQEPPAYARDWAEATGEETMLEAACKHLVEVSVDQADAGHVIVFRYRAGVVAKHAGIMSGRNSFIHAMEGAPVCEVSMTRWWRRRIVAAFAFPGVQA